MNLQLECKVSIKEEKNIKIWKNEMINELSENVQFCIKRRGKCLYINTHSKKIDIIQIYVLIYLADEDVQWKY